MCVFTLVCLGKSSQMKVCVCIWVIIGSTAWGVILVTLTQIKSSLSGFKCFHQLNRLDYPPFCFVQHVNSCRFDKPTAVHCTRLRRGDKQTLERFLKLLLISSHVCEALSGETVSPVSATGVWALTYCCHLRNRFSVSLVGGVMGGVNLPLC